MSCINCAEALKEDSAEPGCFGGACLIGFDSLASREKTVIGLRHKLLALNGLVDPATVLRMYGATLEHLELLAAMEEEIKGIRVKEDYG